MNAIILRRSARTAAAGLRRLSALLPAGASRPPLPALSTATNRLLPPALPAATIRRLLPVLPAAASLLLAGLLATAQAQAGAQASAGDACAGFRWDVSHERALFASPAITLKAAADAAAAPQVEPDRLYALQLTPQDQVHFALPPGKTMLADGAYAGLVHFRVPAAGSYRVAVDTTFWLDVIANGKELPTEDFQGQQGCQAPHKIVEYVMPANTDLMLQFSGQTRHEVHVTITRAPA